MYVLPLAPRTKALTLVPPSIDRQNLITVTQRLITDYRWTVTEAADTEADFRLFLTVARCYEGEVLVPYAGLDTFWREVVLHTELYARLCNECFAGRVLHHHLCLPDVSERHALRHYFSATRDKFLDLFDYAPAGFQSSAGDSFACFDLTALSRRPAMQLST